MRTVPIPDALDHGAWSVTEHSPRSKLVAEICERLVEWSEIENRVIVRHWIVRLATMCCDPESVEAPWLYMRISTGDFGELTRSFAERGAKHQRTKQGEQQETERALLVINRHFPELEKAITGLMNHCARDPVSHKQP